MFSKKVEVLVFGLYFKEERLRWNVKLVTEIYESYNENMPQKSCKITITSQKDTNNGKNLWQFFFPHHLSLSIVWQIRLFEYMWILIDIQRRSTLTAFPSSARFAFIIYAHIKKNYEFDWKRFNLLPIPTHCADTFRISHIQTHIVSLCR